MYVKESVMFGGKELSIETGKMAKQADGAVLIRYGDSVVMVTAVSAKTPREGVEFRFKPGILTLPRGTSHGSTYWYDRHVPMIFMGGGIPAGTDPSRAATVDMAPTFAAMLGIPYPKDLDGKLLTAVVKKSP